MNSTNFIHACARAWANPQSKRIQANPTILTAFLVTLPEMCLTTAGICLTVGAAMRPARSLLIYFVAVFIGGALLAPWLFFLTQNLAPHSSLAGHPLHRFLDRSLLGLALLGIWPLLRSCGMASWSQVGIVAGKAHKGEYSRATLIGAFSIFAIFALSILCGGREPVVGEKNVSHMLAGALAAAIIVSILEELLFRGALFGALRQSMDWRLAALLSSIVYAFVHFLQKADLPGPVTWKSGLELLPLMIRNAMDARLFLPAIVNLTVAGLAFAVAYQRTGALYASMGLHSVWIFLLKTFLYFSQPSPNASVLLWGGDNLLNGWGALPVLLAALIFIFRWLPVRVKNHD